MTQSATAAPATIQPPTSGTATPPVGDRVVAPDTALRDLRLAFAELGEAVASQPPGGATAGQVAAWLTAVAGRLGLDLMGLPPNPVLLARAHAAVGGALSTAGEVADAPALAAQARGITRMLLP
jgi:hypothetical protein